MKDFKVPEGWSIKERSDYEITIVKNKEPALPKRWEELDRVDGEYISSFSTIDRFCWGDALSKDRNVIPLSIGGNAVLHLIMLLQLKDRYNDGWVPDWNDESPKWCIYVYNRGMRIYAWVNTSFPLHFKTKELAEEFLENFRDYLEIAKPLL